jgi:hypothetical protein
MPTTRSTVGSTGVAGGLETARCRDGATATEYLDVDPAGKQIPFSGPDGY